MTGTLHTQALSVRRGGRPVLREVTFELPPGEILVIVGANGAGKTTLLEAVLGFQPTSSGTVTFAGRPLRDLRARARVFSYVPDEAEPPAEVAVATLLAHARRHGRAEPRWADELEEALALPPLRRARAGQLSRGEKKRLMLFAALCGDRPVAVLDEPLGVFDPLQLVSVLALLRRRAAAGHALLLSVHQMADAEKIASRVLILHEGSVLALGTPDALGKPLEGTFLALLEERSRARA
jgi:ABC-type multidrug transport system ATPase subunit